MTAPTPIDPEKYKTTTRAQWQTAAKPWSYYGPLLRRWLGPATEQMLDLAGVGAGDHVLDVAAGAGDQSLMAAERVGPTGRVLATDLSPAILEEAQQSARAAGLALETLTMDGEVLDVPPGSFDAVISRVGMIYFPNQQAALASMKRALRPGGRIGIITYSTAEKNRFFSLPVSIIRHRAALPPPAPGQPGPFSLGTPGILGTTLEQAGLRDIEIRTVEAPLRMPSAQACLDFEKESFGALHQMLSGLSKEQQRAAWDQIRGALVEFEHEGGFAGPCELLVAAGTA